MITNRIFQAGALICLFLLPVQAAEIAISSKAPEKADYVEQDGTIVVHGTIAPLPYSTTIKDYVNSFYSPGTSLMPAFPTLTKEDIISRFCCQSATCQDWNAHEHPLLKCTCPDYLPVLLPIVYKSPSPHPFFLKKAVEEHLTKLPPPLCGIVSQYAANPTTLFDCTEGDTIQIFLPNHDNKKALAQLTCTKSYGDRYRIQVARGLIRNNKIPLPLKALLQRELETHDRQELERLKKEQEKLLELWDKEAKERQKAKCIFQ